MAIAETLKVTNRVDIKVDKVDGKVDKVDGKVDKVDDTVNRMDDTVNRVDDTVNRTDDTVNRVADKVTLLFDGGQNPSLFLFYAFLNMHATANEREKLKNWLSPPDPSTNHNIARKAHHEGTASWFFQGSIFKQWKSSPLLWIHGKRTFLYLSITPEFPPNSLPYL